MTAVICVDAGLLGESLNLPYILEIVSPSAKGMSWNKRAPSCNLVYEQTGFSSQVHSETQYIVYA